MMTIAIEAEALLSRVTPERCAEYLREKGFTEACDRGNGWLRFPKRNPDHFAYCNVREPVEFIDRLAGYLQKSPLAVLADLVGREAVQEALAAALGPDPAATNDAADLAALRRLEASGLAWQLNGKAGVGTGCMVWTSPDDSEQAIEASVSEAVEWVFKRRAYRGRRK